ncbi:MAG: hypothetical protein WCI11_15745 [Candidatus Methylumidiphilus sp.]
MKRHPKPSCRGGLIDIFVDVKGLESLAASGQRGQTPASVVHIGATGQAV